MNLSDLKPRKTETISPDSGIQAAAALMKSAHIGMLPVVEGDTVVGVLTDRDIVVRGLSSGLDNKKVRDVMSPNPVTLQQDSDTGAAMKMMSERRIGRLVLVDRENRLTGVVSAGDIAIACKGEPAVQELACALSESHQNVGV
jgi:CBS domain-containing protein